MSGESSRVGVRAFFRDLDRLRAERRITFGQWASRAGLAYNTLKYWRDRRWRLSDWTWFEIRDVVAAVAGPDPAALLPWQSRWDSLRRSAGELPADPGRGGADLSGVARQLPVGIRHLVGRDDAEAWLDAMLADSVGAQARVAVVTGMPGVGKTALAVHWCHSVAQLFPDGQLYADLSGGGDPHTPVSVGDVLGRFLRALGVGRGDVPADVEEAACLYRSLLAERRVLILLDNVGDADHAIPLLPASSTTAVVITARHRLSRLTARTSARVLTLGILAPNDAAELLVQSIGEQRAEAEPRAFAELVTHCAGLPLALRIAGERVAAHPGLRLADLADELADRRLRLTALSTTDDGLAARATFSWSYDGLPEPAAALFRLLGLHPGRDLSGAAVAALAGVPAGDAGRLLSTLAGAHLLNAAAPGRYQMHDLLNVYANELAEQRDSVAVRDNAINRLFMWYLHTAANADRLLLPGREVRVPLEPIAAEPWQPLAFTGHEQAMAWFKTEQANLTAVMRHAARARQHAIAWKLPAAMWAYYYLQSPATEWLEAYHVAEHAARRLNDHFGLAWTLNGLGVAHWSIGRLREAESSYLQSLPYWRKIEHRRGEAITLNNLAATCAEAGPPRFEEAHQYFHQALAIRVDIGDRLGIAQTLTNLAQLCCDCARFEQAIDYCGQASAIHRSLTPGSPMGEANALHILARAHHGLGDHDAAVRLCHRALDIRRAINHEKGKADTLTLLGDILDRTGRRHDAQLAWKEAVDILDATGDTGGTLLRARLRRLQSTHDTQPRPR